MWIIIIIIINNSLSLFLFLCQTSGNNARITDTIHMITTFKISQSLTPLAVPSAFMDT